MGTFTLPRQGDRKVVPTRVIVRRMTVEEIRALHAGQRVACVLNNGRLGAVTINGAVRTWKTQPDRIEVPIKYGMREYATFDLTEACTRFVVELPQ